MHDYNQIDVKFAEQVDMDWCIERDFSIKEYELMKNKILRHEIIVAEIDGKRVGYLRMEYLWGKIPYMSVIEVLPQHQRHGVGGSLLKFLENKLRADGAPFLITSAEASMPEAQAWHRRMGFIEIGVISGLNPNNSDEIFFKKVLSKNIGLAS